MNGKDEHLLELARRGLDGHAEAIDPMRAARLAAARRRAVEAAAGGIRRPGVVPTGWLAVGLATAGAVALAVWLVRPAAPLPGNGDLEILISGEDLEMVEELDFYLWLEEADRDAG